MLNFFIDTSSEFLTLILEKNNELIYNISIYSKQQYVELTNMYINNVLKKFNFKLKDINSFYVTKGPGSYTGIKVAITIVKTIKMINNNVNIYLINSLIYYAGLTNTIFMIKLQNNKFYFVIIKNGKEIFPTKIIDKKTCLIISKKYPNYILKNKLTKINFLHNYFILKNEFELVNDINNLNPLYISSII